MGTAHLYALKLINSYWWAMPTLHGCMFYFHNFLGCVVIKKGKQNG